MYKNAERLSSKQRRTMLSLYKKKLLYKKAELENANLYEGGKRAHSH